MKIKKIFCAAVSVVTSMFTIASFSVNAGFGINPNEITYSLDQLIEMSDEKFLSLENSLIPGGAQAVYNYVDKHSRGDYLKVMESNYYNKMGGYYLLDTYRDFYYRPNYTETLINELLSDSPYEYRLTSPLDIDRETVYYNHYFSIVFPELGLEGEGELPDATDENVMLAAKILYCLQQACPNWGWSSGIVDLGGVKNEIETGDVTFDQNVDLYDVIWIASDLSGIFELTDAQKTVGDVNDDGECDLYDAIEIAKGLM